MSLPLARRSKLVAAVVFALAVALGVAGQAMAVVPQAGGLGVDTVERPFSLHPQGIEIEANELAANSSPTVVYSVGLSDFAASERIRVAASVYGTYCIPPDITPAGHDGNKGNAGSPCIDRFWSPGTQSIPRKPSYPIRIKARVYLAREFRDPSNGASILGANDAFCDEIKHHCPVEVALDRTVADPYPGRADVYVNVEVMAWETNNSSVWRRGDLLELEGDCYDGARGPLYETSYHNCDPVVGNVDSNHNNPNRRAGTKGQLSVLRFGSSYTPGPVPSYSNSTIRPANQNVFVGAGPAVVHSTRVGSLRAGDILEAHAGTVHVVGRGFDHALESWWVLGSSPTTEQPQSGANSDERYVSAMDAVNCLDPNNRDINGNHSGDCTVGQRGAVAVPSGLPANQPMYLNFVAEATDGSTPSGIAQPRAEFRSGTFNLTCEPFLTAPSCAFTAVP